jgi:hypothetical protein
VDHSVHSEASNRKAAKEPREPECRVSWVLFAAEHGPADVSAAVPGRISVSLLRPRGLRARPRCRQNDTAAPSRWVTRRVRLGKPLPASKNRPGKTTQTRCCDTAMLLATTRIQPKDRPRAAARTSAAARTTLTSQQSAALTSHLTERPPLSLAGDDVLGVDLTSRLNHRIMTSQSHRVLHCSTQRVLHCSTLSHSTGQLWGPSGGGGAPLAL